VAWITRDSGTEKNIRRLLGGPKGPNDKPTKKIASSGFAVKKFSPRRTRRARRREDLIARRPKDAKNSPFRSVGTPPGGCPFEDANSPRSPRHLESEISETFVSFVLFVVNKKN
jgi:hypothetical protein